MNTGKAVTIAMGLRGCRSNQGGEGSTEAVTFQTLETSRMLIASNTVILDSIN